MTSPQFGIEEDDFGIEYFDDVVKQRTRGGQGFEEQDEFESEAIPSTETESLARRAIGGLGRAVEGIGQIGLLVPKDMPRHAARSAARAGETLIGLPGDIREFTGAIGGWLGDKARSLMGKEPLTEEQKEYIREQTKPKNWDLIGKLAESFPTSQEVREGITRKYTGDYLEPQNKKEAFADEVVQDFTVLAIPIKGKPPFARALGTSLFANSGAEIADAFFGEDAKNYTKLGLLFFAGMVGRNQGGVKKYISGLYDDMRAEVPEGASVSSKNLSNKLNRIESALKKGDPAAASKQEAFQKINAIKNKISGGEISIDEILELTRDVNESIYDSKGLVRGQNKLYDVRDALHNATKEYGATNEAFASKWKDANQAFASTEMSRKVGNWVKKNISPKDYAYAASAFGLEGALIGAPMAFKTAAGVSALGATAYSAEVLKRISQSPALRRYYMNTVTSSLQQNKASLMRNMKFLNDGLEKDFKENPYETVDFEEEN